MRVVDLTDNFENLYFVCLEDWSDEMKEAGDHKEVWYRTMKEKGLQVKLALDDHDIVGGMIQYLPIEESFVSGKDLYFINCIWVHGHKKGRGSFQKQGMGVALLAAAEENARQLGAKGMAAWGLAIPAWMKASWFRRHGYKKADQQGIQVLLWKPFDESAEPPQWIKPKKKPVAGKDKVNLTILKNGWCPAMNLAYERAKRAAEGFGDMVDVLEIDTLSRETFWEWGISDGLFIDEKEVRVGPPPTVKKLEKKIGKRVKKLK